MKTTLFLFPLVCMAQSVTMQSAKDIVYVQTDKCDQAGKKSLATQNQVCIYDSKSRHGEWLKTPSIDFPPMPENYNLSVGMGMYGSSIRISEKEIKLPDGMTEHDAILTMARAWAQSIDQSNKVFNDEQRRLTSGWQNTYDALKICTEGLRQFNQHWNINRREKDVL